MYFMPYAGWYSCDDEAESTERGDKAEINFIIRSDVR